MAVRYTLLLAAALALYESPHITNVPYHALRDTVLTSNYLYLSVVYDADGEKSKKLEPIILKTAETYQSLIRTLSIDCYSDPERCTPETRENLPGVMVSYYAGVDPVSKEKKVFQETFLGALSVKGLGDFILGNMPFFGTELSYRNLQWFLDLQGLNKVLLFSDKDNVPSLYKALTSAFRARMDFAVVWKNQTDIVEQYGVKWFPTLLLLTSDRRLEYDGDLNFEELERFLSPHAASAEIADRYTIRKPVENEPATKVTAADYRAKLAEVNSKTAAVYFFKGKPEPEWDQFKVTYRGMVEFFELGLDEEELEQELVLAENIEELPAMKIQFPFSKLRHTTFENVDALLLENIKYDMVKIDVDVPKTFLEYMKKQEKLGAIYVTEEEVPVQFRALTKDPFLRDRIVFGAYRNDTVQKFVDLFKLSRTPALMATYSVKGEQVEFKEYSGDLRNHVLMRYFLEKLMIPMFHNETQMKQEDWKDEEVEEFTAKSYANGCMKKPSFCLVGLMEGQDSLFKSKQNRDLLTSLKKAQAYSEAKGRPFRVGYLDADCEFEFRKAAGVREKDLPAVVAFQGVKNRVFRLGEELTETNVRMFIDQVTFNKEKGEDGLLEPTDRDCTYYRNELKRLSKAKPEATRKELLQSYLDSEQALRAEGKMPPKKPKSRKNEL